MHRTTLHMLAQQLQAVAPLPDPHADCEQRIIALEASLANRKTLNSMLGQWLSEIREDETALLRAIRRDHEGHSAPMRYCHSLICREAASLVQWRESGGGS